MEDSFRNILVIGQRGAGKSLLSAVLTGEYDIFPICDDTERPHAEAHFVQATCGTFRILDWEGDYSVKAFKKLLNSESEKK